MVANNKISTSECNVTNIFKEITMGITSLKLLTTPSFYYTHKTRSTQGFKPKLAYKLQIIGV
jgi:hypothetical protein